MANYPSSSLVVRNLAETHAKFEFLEEHERFRIVRFDPPYFAGSEFWIVNEKGFLWEAVKSVDAALDYLLSDEAREYNEAGAS